MRSDLLNKIVLPLIALLYSACIEQEVVQQLGVVENQSSSSVKVIIYGFFDLPPTDSIVIQSGEQKKFCSFPTGNIRVTGLSCELEAIEYRFDNDRGYYCLLNEDNTNRSDLCFFNSDPFNVPQLTDGRRGTLFTITQEDFENARELP